MRKRKRKKKRAKMTKKMLPALKIHKALTSLKSQKTKQMRLKLSKMLAQML